SIEGEDAVSIDIQNTHLKLNRNRWSGWVDVRFDAGLFRKIKGIFKFYLVETDPEFKLYVSPINLDPRQPYFPITYPAGYGKELADAIGLFYTQGMPCDTWSVNEKRLMEGAFLEQVGEVLREKKAMLDYELNRMKEGVLFCYFETSDIIQHMFWRYTDPEHPLYEEEGAKIYGNVISGWYQKMDSILGEVMKKMDEDDLLIVLSDHGFDTFRRAIHVNKWLRDNGYLRLKDPQAASGRELLLDIDWSGTKAYAIGFGSIYVNQAGRESGGIVKPGSETEALKKELAEKLLKWQDEKYNKPVLSRVFAKEEIFWGPFLDEMPDLYLGSNIGYRASWQTALGAVPENAIEDNLKKWSGSHLFDPGLVPGILFINRPVTKKDPSIYDIAPTILKETGMPEDDIKACDFDGQPLY
ncbi:alkaline phosphatase family protein, partial [Candidatus Omnitrophota bacterium]